jgi:hypothetical protein
LTVCGVLAEKMRDQQRYVITPLAQGRHWDIDYIQAVPCFSLSTLAGIKTRVARVN